MGIQSYLEDIWTAKVLTRVGVFLVTGYTPSTSAYPPWAVVGWALFLETLDNSDLV